MYLNIIYSSLTHSTVNSLFESLLPFPSEFKDSLEVASFTFDDAIRFIIHHIHCDIKKKTVFNGNT